MSEIVIRCPNCGTTQSALGECEACHEADTRYFCTNHEPGRWLDGPACSACGARYGVPRASTRPPPPRARPEPPVARPRPSPLPDDAEAVPVEVWSGPIRTPGRDDVFEIETGTVELPERRGAPPFPVDGLTLAATASGCVRRAIVLFLILMALAALAIFGLLGVGIRLL